MPRIPNLKKTLSQRIGGTPRSKTFHGVLGLCLTAGLAAPAAAITYDLTGETQTLGNKHSSFQPSGPDGSPAPFKIRSNIRLDPTLPFEPFAAGISGTVAVNEDGTGIQKRDRVSGSGNVSVNEELVITLFEPIRFADLTIGFSAIDLLGTEGPVDQPAVFASLKDQAPFSVVIDTPTFASAFTPTGPQTGELSFADLAGGGEELELLTSQVEGDATDETSGFDPESEIEMLKIRETNYGHRVAYLRVDEAGESVIPEPLTGGLCLLGLGAIGFATHRRRRAIA